MSTDALQQHLQSARTGPIFPLTGRVAVRLLVGIAAISCSDSASPSPESRVAAITISQESATLVPGATVTLVATTLDDFGVEVDAPVAWTSSDNPKASVSSAGVVSGVAVGVATITATSNNKSAITAVTVKEGGVVGPAGGSVSGLSGAVTLTIPAGAVASSTNFTIEAAQNPPASTQLVPGTAIELGPDGQAFAVPLQLRVQYNASQVPGTAPERLASLHRNVSGVWQPVAGTQLVDLIGKTVSANLSGFSMYAILAAEPVSTVTLSITSAPLEVQTSLQLVATTRGATGNVLSDRDVTWSTSNEGVATVSTTGLVTGVTPGGPVQITATSEGHSATADITVTAHPLLVLSSSALTFNAVLGGPNPPSQLVTLTNGGGGTLSGLSVGTITYGPGASGWLQPPSLSSTSANPTATVTLQPVTGGLAQGTYTANIPILSTVATNSPQNLAVTLVVGAPTTPLIALSSFALNFNAVLGGANPSSQVVTITNGGGGSLTGLEVGTIVYGAGATGWLQPPVLSSTTASPSATLTVQPVTGALAAGTYTATIPVLSSVAPNSPQNIAVTFIVAPTVVDPCLVATLPSIAVGQTRNESLAPGDCLQMDGEWSDGFLLAIAQSTPLQIDMMSPTFDTFLILLTIVGGQLFLVDFNDDFGGGTDSRISRTLTAGTYIVLASSFFAGETGPYTLSVIQTAADGSSSIEPAAMVPVSGLRNLNILTKKKR